MAFRSFTSLNTLRPTTTTVGSRNFRKATTIFSDNIGKYIVVRSIYPGIRGNLITVNLVRMLANGSRYKMKLYYNGEAIETKTVTGDVGATLNSLVNTVNENANMKKYIRATLIKDSIGLFNSCVGIGNGQSMRGGR